MRKTENPMLNWLAVAMVLALLSSACSINVKKQKNGEDKQVDITTPVGGIHVSKGANPDDVGMAVYPGAHLKQEDSSGNDKSANVNISGFGFGLKVVALEYQSNDAPDKLVAYYKDQLKKYGKVLECHTNEFNFNPDVNEHEHSSHELTCEGSTGINVELKVGTKENQHIVAIKPEGSGCSFSLVYVKMHGKDADI